MKYIIGVDLGTINSSVAYVDLDKNRNPSLGIQQFQILQNTAPNATGSFPVLPSFCYLSGESEWPENAFKLPWQNNRDYFVGVFAQSQGAKVPTRLIQSAKSWLCHAGVNRKERILPLDCADEIRRISPVEATARYLKHMRDSWNSVIAGNDPAKEWDLQTLVITIPASFDEAARALTVEAAKMAGFEQFTLLEEPQAAFYSWIAQHENNLAKQFKAGQTILVCDVGGGTTDFSLIEVGASQNAIVFQRMAVGEHLLLGGDNMDAALAHYLEAKLKDLQKPDLTTQQWLQLTHEARMLKEKLLDPACKNSKMTVTIQGTGSSVIQGSITVDVEREEVINLLTKGFFDQYSWDEAVKLKKNSGFRTLGLPYEEDPSITKQLASFLSRHKAKPDFVLFNGGTMKPAIFQNAIIDSLKNWFPHHSLQVLESSSLDLAVARGAAYYGKVRQGLGVKIGGGSASSYYLEIQHQQSRKAMTLLKRGAEEGDSYESEQEFLLLPNQPVSFSLYSSHVRLNDNLGDLIEINPDELHPLPSIHTILNYGKKTQDEQIKIPVRVGIRLTEIGTIEIWLRSLKSDHRWQLEFQVRTAGGQEVADAAKVVLQEQIDENLLQQAEQLIHDLFLGQKIKPKDILNQLEALIGKQRKDWSPTLLRSLWGFLLKYAPQRKVSSDHEARWWNLAGFFLRPGRGYPLDDFRLKELWKIILADFKNIKNSDAQIQQWICFRRVSAGFNRGQQMQIAQDLISTLLPKKGIEFDIKGKAAVYHFVEKIRAIAAMELIDQSLKIRVGEALIHRIETKEALPVDFWALGRIAARQLTQGSIAHVLPKDICGRWLEKLVAFKHLPEGQETFLYGQMARLTDYREINISKDIISKILEKTRCLPQANHLRDLLTSVIKLSREEEEEVFGENLPPGLSL